MMLERLGDRISVPTRETPTRPPDTVSGAGCILTGWATGGYRLEQLRRADKERPEGKVEPPAGRPRARGKFVVSKRPGIDVT
jgi:hypothetical protein